MFENRSEIWVSFVSDGSNTDWGWKLTASPLASPAARDKLASDLTLRVIPTNTGGGTSSGNFSLDMMNMASESIPTVSLGLKSFEIGGNVKRPSLGLALSLFELVMECGAVAQAESVFRGAEGSRLLKYFVRCAGVVGEMHPALTKTYLDIVTRIILLFHGFGVAWKRDQGPTASSVVSVTDLSTCNHTIQSLTQHVLQLAHASSKARKAGSAGRVAAPSPLFQAVAQAAVVAASCRGKILSPTSHSEAESYATDKGEHRRTTEAPASPTSSDDVSVTSTADEDLSGVLGCRSNVWRDSGHGTEGAEAHLSSPAAKLLLGPQVQTCYGGRGVRRQLIPADDERVLPIAWGPVFPIITFPIDRNGHNDVPPTTEASASAVGEATTSTVSSAGELTMHSANSTVTGESIQQTVLVDEKKSYSHTIYVKINKIGDVDIGALAIGAALLPLTPADAAGVGSDDAASNTITESTASVDPCLEGVIGSFPHSIGWQLSPIVTAPSSPTTARASGETSAAVTQSSLLSHGATFCWFDEDSQHSRHPPARAPLVPLTERGSMARRLSKSASFIHYFTKSPPPSSSGPPAQVKEQVNLGGDLPSAAPVKSCRTTAFSEGDIIGITLSVPSILTTTSSSSTSTLSSSSGPAGGGQCHGDFSIEFSRNGIQVSAFTGYSNHDLLFSLDPGCSAYESAAGEYNDVYVKKSFSGATHEVSSIGAASTGEFALAVAVTLPPGAEAVFVGPNELPSSLRKVRSPRQCHSSLFLSFILFLGQHGMGSSR